ncbi:hypothetical protein STANM309S_03349 [Streptomyces tanashiensis]
MVYETVSFGSETGHGTQQTHSRAGVRAVRGRALELLREVGYDALTIDAVAARTHSSKATLYRQWGSKPELVARAMRHNKPVDIAEIDTGSLRGDIQAMLAHTDDCQMDKDAALMRGLAHAVHTNPELHRALRELLIEPEMNGLDEVLGRAVLQGRDRRREPGAEARPAHADRCVHRPPADRGSAGRPRLSSAPTSTPWCSPHSAPDHLKHHLST